MQNDFFKDATTPTDPQITLEQAVESKPLPKTLPDLGYFTGTEQWHRHSLSFRGNPLLYTDGVLHVAETAQAFWLLDVIFSHVVAIYGDRNIRDDRKNLLVCKLKRDDHGNAATFTTEDGDYGHLATQRIEYTDFPALEQTIWVQNGVAMLSSEY